MNEINFDKEYPLNNNNYEQNDTQISFLNVAWNNSYNDVVDFSSRAVQTSELNKLVKKTTNYLNYISKDKAFKVAGNVEDYTYYNYVRYINKNYSDRYVYAFITRVEYLSKNTTLIYIESDVWQTWLFDLKYKMCFIERSHIAKSDDILYSNLESEPVGASPSFEKQIDIFDSLDWSLRWCAETLSSPPIINGSNNFEYGGVGTDNTTFCGHYLYPLSQTNTAHASREFLELFYPSGNVTDHRQDIIQIRCLPNWVVMDTNTENYCLINSVANKQDNATFSQTTLPCGYTPKNKKMFSSLFRVIIIYNHNGFSIPLKPELINGNNINISLSMKGATSSLIKLSVLNYAGYSNNHYYIPYNSTMATGYNENTGVKQGLDVFNSFMGIGQSVVNTGSGIYSAVSSSATSGTPLNPFAIASTVMTGVSGVVNNAVSAKSAFEQKTATIGGMSDTISVLPTNIRLRLIDCSPTYTECKHIDDFFERFGYAINDFGQLNNWINNRSQWNYIKTVDAKIQLDGNQDDLQKIISMFNNGVTIWHSVENFGNYNVSNN